MSFLGNRNDISMICLDEKYSTTRLVAKEKPEIVNNSEDKFESVLFLPEGESRKGEGGLRSKGLFKKSYEDKPLISIVTVVFNGEQFLEETIQSVINQTYDNVEYIVIDGGSSDGTLDIIKKYEDRVDYWVSEKDKGIYDAMNKGIDLSTGKWMNFMNAGDTFYSSTILKEQTKFFQNDNLSLIYGNTFLSMGKLKKPHSIDWLNYGMIAVHQSMFFKKHELRYNLYYKIAGDYHLVLQYLNKFGKDSFHYVDIVVSNFDMQGVSNQDRNIGNKEYLVIAIKELNISIMKAVVFYYIRKLRNLL
jgi:glycosyltransferase involved in cell wall biosynthesis